VPRYVVPVTHRPQRDGTIPASRHVPFYLALETASDAWALALAEHCGSVVTPGELAMVHVDSDFGRELFTGELGIEVAVRRIGRTSITVGVELFQADVPAGTVTFVLAKVDADRVHSVPLTEKQHAALESLLVLPAPVD
jgi:acyl-CoA thioesterase FadM